MPGRTHRTHHELETKLVPAPDVELSSLDGVVPEAHLEVRPTLELTAVYYDTPALTLARAGITVRHRIGHGPDTWTVKLPVGDDEGAIARREFSVEGPRNRRPREVAAAVAAHLRGRRLAVVAEVHTIRTRVAVVDDAGAEVLEVAHDLVAASRGPEPLGSWEEIEVEAADHRDAAVALRTVVGALTERGCRPAPQIPKLVRALGPSAQEPPDVTVPELGPDPTVSDTLHRALARSVAQLLHHDPLVRAASEPEDLHQLRVALRRLRSDLRTFEELLDATEAEALRAELAWAAGETGARRDLDVLRAWLLDRGSDLPADDGPGLAVLVARADAEAAVARTRLLRLLASGRYLDLVHRLVALVDEPHVLPKKADRRARRHLERRVAERWAQLERKIDRLGPDPDDHHLHRARIATKRARAAVEAIVPIEGKEARKLAKALARLQDALGGAHDAAVFEAWLRTVDEPGAASFTAGELAVLARQDQQHHRGSWPDAWQDARHRRTRLG
jgi:CHAD domain-containing protein